MEVNAAFMEHVDYHIGRVIDHIEEMGELDNTPLPLKNLSSERSIQKPIWCKTFLIKMMKNHQILERNQVNIDERTE